MKKSSKALIISGILLITLINPVFPTFICNLLYPTPEYVIGTPCTHVAVFFYLLSFLSIPLGIILIIAGIILEKKS